MLVGYINNQLLMLENLIPILKTERYGYGLTIAYYYVYLCFNTCVLF